MSLVNYLMTSPSLPVPAAAGGILFSKDRGTWDLHLFYPDILIIM
jgi:hypothetical protein